MFFVLYTPQQNEGYCHHNVVVVVVCRLSTFPPEQHNSSKSYPILMKLHMIVPWWVRMDPVKFFYDDVIIDVISGCPLSFFKYHNSTKSYSILMKLNRIVPWRVMMNPIKFYDHIISDVISGDIAL